MKKSFLTILLIIIMVLSIVLLSACNREMDSQQAKETVLKILKDLNALKDFQLETQTFSLINDDEEDYSAIENSYILKSSGEQENKKVYYKMDSRDITSPDKKSYSQNIGEIYFGKAGDKYYYFLTVEDNEYQQGELKSNKSEKEYEIVEESEFLEESADFQDTIFKNFFKVLKYSFAELLELEDAKITATKSFKNMALTLSYTEEEVTYNMNIDFTKDRINKILTTVTSEEDGKTIEIYSITHVFTYNIKSIKLPSTDDYDLRENS